MLLIRAWEGALARSLYTNRASLSRMRASVCTHLVFTNGFLNHKGHQGHEGHKENQDLFALLKNFVLLTFNFLPRRKDFKNFV